MKPFICLLSLLIVAACAHQHTPRFKSKPAQTRVETPYGTLKYHCPPGQAKKGRC